MLNKQRNTVKMLLESGSKLLLLVVMLLGLSACATEAKDPSTDVLKQPIDPSILAPTHEQAADIQSLATKGVKVFQVGATMMIILPSDQVFNPGSANLNTDYLSTLDSIANLMSTYDKEDVRVNAYTDNLLTKEMSQALSTRQAQVLTNYLWAKSTDSRLMYANGEGQLSPVAANNTQLGIEQNRRVVISFKFYPKLHEWD